MGSYLNYLAPGMSTGAVPSASPDGSDFMQSLGSAFARSRMAGGGLGGLVSALSPSFGQGVQNTMQPMNWGTSPQGAQSGLKF